MADQLQVYNPNDGKWYEIDRAMPYRSIPLDRLYLRSDGSITNKATPKCSAGSEVCFNILTPCDPPIWATLGKERLEHVPDKYRSRVIGYHAPATHECYLYQGRALTAGGNHHPDHPAIILNPPEPEPKSDRDYVEGFVKLLNGIRVTNGEVIDMVDDAKKHLAAQKQQ